MILMSATSFTLCRCIKSRINNKNAQLYHKDTANTEMAAVTGAREHSCAQDNTL